MSETAIVALTNPASGGVALRRQDGSYVLAEQLDAQPLAVGQELVGEMAGVGVEKLTDVRSKSTYTVFVQAYDLGLAAVQDELATDAR